MVIKDPGFSQKVTPHGTPPSPSEWTEITVPDHWLTLKVRIIERLLLDDAERRYLSAVIRPFRNDEMRICKKNDGDYEEYIFFAGEKSFYLPNFEAGTMYKGMELGRGYMLEELGL